MKPRYNVIDLFCGCGGASLGLKLEGHRVVGAVDVDPIACKAFSDNLDLEPLCRDIRFLTGEKLLESYGLGKGDVDIVIGCPPCQGFSSLRQTRYPTGEDDRKELVAIFVKRIHEIQPKAVIFENVPGISRKKGIKYLNRFLSEMEEKGYKTVWKSINMADYGVPQFRKRVITLCVKDVDSPLTFPCPTHSNTDEIEADLKPWRTVRDAIGNLPPLKPGESHLGIPNHVARNHTSKVLEIIRNVPKDGGSRRDLPENLWLPCHLKLKENKSGGAESVYGRLAWDKPAPTITCRCTTPSSGRFIHPEQDRAITPREAACLQSFPDDFTFPDNFTQSERLIGNAVPPDLMAILVESFNDTL